MARRLPNPDEIEMERGPAAPGPSDSSDSGSDLLGEDLPEGATDRHGTGERASVEEDAEVPPGADIAPDRVVSESEAGLGGGLDQAEEAQLGITDEEIAALSGDGEDDEL